MKRVHIGWIIPAVLLISGCLSGTAYGESGPGGQLPEADSGSHIAEITGEAAESANGAGERSVSASVGREEIPPVVIPAHLVYAGRDFLYHSDDGGATWNRMNIKPQISDATYLTAAAVNPADPDHLVVGTSYYGLFESTNRGATWTDMDPESALSQLYQGAGFYNEIAALAFSADGDELYIRGGFGGSTFRWNLTKRSEGLSAGSDQGSVSEFNGGNPETDYILSQIIHGSAAWPDGFPLPPNLAEDSVLPESFVRDEAWLERRRAASDKFGIYINAWQVTNRLDEFIDYMQRMGFNSAVIDFKDDLGLLRYDSALETARRADTVRPLFDARELIARFHEAGIYVIARVVVFKDKALYAYDGNRYALWDERLEEPWGVYRQRTPEASAENPDPEPYWEQVEYWVDPYSEFVRDYNIAIAAELEELGVNEIQFDYIRFPSDGRTRDIVTRFLLDENGQRAHVDINSQRVRILSTFLREARQVISIPIGTDVFGFNGWARMSYLGQDIEAISHYVDVISPMSYPSHYPRSFYRELSYLDRAQLIFEEGTRRAREITDDRSLIRQYVQAFLLGSELNFEQPVYFDYLNRQLRGTILGGGNGFTLWNNSGRYYMVDPESVPDYIRRAAEASEGFVQ